MAIDWLGGSSKLPVDFSCNLQRPSSQNILVAASHFLAQVARLMGDGLVVGLTVTSVPGYVKTLFRLCAIAAEAGNISS